MKYKTLCRRSYSDKITKKDAVGGSLVQNRIRTQILPTPNTNKILHFHIGKAFNVPQIDFTSSVKISTLAHMRVSHSPLNYHKLLHCILRHYFPGVSLPLILKLLEIWDFFSFIIHFVTSRCLVLVFRNPGFP